MSASPNITPEPIFQMLTGFWVSKALMAAVELGVFTKLSGRRASLEELQDFLAMEERPAEVFATSQASLGLLEVTTSNNGERSYSNSALTDLFLDKSKPSYMGDIVTMFDKRLYNMRNSLPQCLLENKPAGGSGEEMFD